MPSRLRSSVTLAVLTAVLLVALVVPAVDAHGPRATRYHAGGQITLDTNLRSKSGTSAWAIDEYLAATTPLPPLGAAFMSAEKTYRVNARFLLAAALHESAWGTSSIARVKHNLFGYNAYDRDPFRYANAYATYAANIDATAKFISNAYLTPGGRWWGGQPTLRSMQRVWSSSGRWGEGVSRIATSIHLASIKGRSIEFAAPVLGGTLHGGDPANMRLTWKGGALPKAIEFVASWVPVELDADVVATTTAAASAALVAPAAAATVAPAATAGPATTVVPAATAGPKARVPARPTSVAARRLRTGNRSITVALTAPREPGTYLLDVEMRDAGRRPLPAADLVDIPSVEVRVWGDRAVGYDLKPSADGSGAVVRITNTGRETIPAASTRVSPDPRDPEAKPVRTVVTVTASAGWPGSPAPVLLIAAPLPADLLPGASVSFNAPGINAATGRTTSWVSVDVSVLGDATWLAASSTFGAWLADPTAGSPTTTGAGAGSSGSPITAAASPTPAPAATPAATPSPKPAATATPSPKSTAGATPAHARVTRLFAEHSGAVRYRGTWDNAPNGAYLGGQVAWSRTPGSTATFTFTGSSVSWVGPKGPTRGLALVLIDGRAIARVDMWRASFVPRAVLFKRSFRAAGQHTLTIRVLPAPGHPYVAIDGFIVGS